MTDDTGAAWTLSAQRGTPVVLFFGFTHCADTCPDTLARLAHLAGTAGSHNPSVEIAFISVDPQRDTPPVLHRFVQRFATPRARIVGLTGSPEQIDAVETAYHAWAQRIPGKHEGGGYDYAHSDAIVFVDPAGRLQSLHDTGDSDAVLSRALREAAS